MSYLFTDEGARQSDNGPEENANAQDDLSVEAVAQVTEDGSCDHEAADEYCRGRGVGVGDKSKRSAFSQKYNIFNRHVVACPLSVYFSSLVHLLRPSRLTAWYRRLPGIRWRTARGHLHSTLTPPSLTLTTTHYYAQSSGNWVWACRFERIRSGRRKERKELCAAIDNNKTHQTRLIATLIGMDDFLCVPGGHKSVLCLYFLQLNYVPAAGIKYSPTGSVIAPLLTGPQRLIHRAFSHYLRAERSKRTWIFNAVSNWVLGLIRCKRAELLLLTAVRELERFDTSSASLSRGGRVEGPKRKKEEEVVI